MAGARGKASSRWLCGGVFAAAPKGAALAFTDFDRALLVTLCRQRDAASAHFTWPHVLWAHRLGTALRLVW